MGNAYIDCSLNKAGAYVTIDLQLLGTGITPVQAITLILATIGAVFGAVGAVLGVINTWHGLDKSKVKLVVQPAHAIPIGGANPNLNFCISITNLSAFAVTVNEVGVFYHGTKQRGTFVMPITHDGGAWPRRLEPRTSVTIYGQRPTPTQGRIKTAYAKTACGVTATGTSGALKQISRGA